MDFDLANLGISAKFSWFPVTDEESQFPLLLSEESQFPPLSSMELLRHRGAKGKCSGDEKLNPEQSSDSPLLPTESIMRLARTQSNNRQNSDTTQSNASSPPNMSAESIVRLAKELLLQLNSQKVDVLQNFVGSIGAQSGLPSKISKDLELALLLQAAAAEMVANQQFVHVRRLLSLCDSSACKTGILFKELHTILQKLLIRGLIYQWGINSSKTLEGQQPMTTDKELALICLQPAMLACQQEHPFTRITQCAAAETILENVASVKRLRLIDFSIDNGSHWTLMMQDFAARWECPFDLLKIAAVGTCKQMMEETGKRLSSFAETINLPFPFKIVLSNLKNLKEDLIKLEVDEAVAIYSAFHLWTELPWPNQLEALVGVIKNLKPSVIVVIELELSTSIPIFLERFHESLFYLSAMFDYLTACLDNQILCRKLLELRSLLPRDDSNCCHI